MKSITEMVSEMGDREINMVCEIEDKLNRIQFLKLNAKQMRKLEVIYDKISKLDQELRNVDGER